MNTSCQRYIITRIKIKLYTYYNSSKYAPTMRNVLKDIFQTKVARWKAPMCFVVADKVSNRAIVNLSVPKWWPVGRSVLSNKITYKSSLHMCKELNNVAQRTPTFCYTGRVPGETCLHLHVTIKPVNQSTPGIKDC